MSNELKFTAFYVTQPTQEGKRYWSATYTAENFNTQTPNDYNSANPMSQLFQMLSAYGKNAVLHDIAVRYEAAAGGVTIKPLININGSALIWFDFERQITTAAGDSLNWQGYSVPFSITKQYYCLSFDVRNYAATDDMYINLNGEVW